MKTLNISDETYELIKGQLSNDEQVDLSEMNDFIGKTFFFRTVTYHLVGKVEKIIGNLFILSKASWVADSGRFMQAIKEGKLSEVEPVGSAILNLQTVTDAFPWREEWLPREQK